MKKSFSVLEVIFVLLILSLIFTFSTINFKEDKTNLAANRLALYLKQTRNQALIDSKKDKDEPLWHKKRWTLKFLRCRKDIGGLYYVIYSDTNMTGHPSLNESLTDPLTGKKVYTTNQCEYRTNTSKYVLLSKEFDIVDVNVSCNNTSSLGQISFGEDGKIYSKLSNYENSENEFEIKEKCKIILKSQEGDTSELIIQENTGYSYKN